MILAIDLPSWIGDRALRGIAGREHVFTLYPDGSLYIKQGRCNQCGNCCTDAGPLFPEQDVEGVKYCAYCNFDEGKWHCRNPAQPYGCVKDAPPKNPHPECSQTWIKVK